MDFKEEIYNNFVHDFSIILRQEIMNLEISKLIFLCIGTDRITGDSFGPLVGYKLKKVFYKEENIKIIGDLEYIVCSHNILKVINDINSAYQNYFLIAIDAAVSNKTPIGKLVVSNTGMNIRNSLNKKNIYVGDISIKGVVSKDLKNPKHNFKLLQNTPLSLVMKMADSVAEGISNIINV